MWNHATFFIIPYVDHRGHNLFCLLAVNKAEKFESSNGLSLRVNKLDLLLAMLLQFLVAHLHIWKCEDD